MALLKDIFKSISIEPLFLLYFFTGSLQGPTKSALWYRKVCMILYNDDWICDNINQNDSLVELEEEVQIVNSQWNFYDDLCYTIPALFFTFLYGSWSDRISRKIPIMLPLIGNTVSCVLYIFAGKYIQSPGGFMLLINLIDGISGGGATMFMAAMSYMSHVTTPKNRTFRFSIVYGCLYVGSFVGYLVSGILLEETGFTFVYSVSIVLTCICMIYVIFGIKDVKDNGTLGSQISAQDDKFSESQIDDAKISSTESKVVNDKKEANDENYRKCLEVETENNQKKHSTTRESKHTTSTFFNVQHLKEPVLVAFRKRKFNHRVHILAIILCNGLHNVFNADRHISYLFLKHPPLSFTQSQFGYYSSYGTLLTCTCLLVVVPILKKRFQIADSVLYCLALGSVAVDMLIMGLSFSSWVVWLAPIGGYMAGGLWTFSRSMLSTMVGVDEIGKIFAVLSSFQTVCSIPASFLFNYLLYPATVDFYAGFSYIFSAITFTIPLSIAIWIHFDVKKQKKLGSQEKIHDLMGTRL